MFRIGGNTFYNQKNKIPMKILEFKRSGIGLIAEFRGTPNGFPNLAALVEAGTLLISSCYQCESNEPIIFVVSNIVRKLMNVYGNGVDNQHCCLIGDQKRNGTEHVSVCMV